MTLKSFPYKWTCLLGLIVLGSQLWSATLLDGLSFLFGILSILHLVSEAVQLLIWGRGVETLYFITFLLEIPVSLLWLQSGRSLRERKDWALLVAVTTASITLADAIVSGILMGPSMMKFATGHLMDFDIRTGIFGARNKALSTLTVIIDGLARAGTPISRSATLQWD